MEKTKEYLKVSSQNFHEGGRMRSEWINQIGHSNFDWSRTMDGPIG